MASESIAAASQASSSAGKNERTGDNGMQEQRAVESKSETNTDGISVLKRTTRRPAALPLLSSVKDLDYQTKYWRVDDHKSSVSVIREPEYLSLIRCTCCSIRNVDIPIGSDCYAGGKGQRIVRQRCVNGRSCKWYLYHVPAAEVGTGD